MSAGFDARKDVPALRRAAAAYIAALMEDLLPPMRLTARGAGYALAVHGTQARDIDLVAIPWTDAASSPDHLVQQLTGVIAGVTGQALKLNSWNDKPHGRRAITIIHGGDGAEIDLSVMPRIEKEEA